MIRHNKRKVEEIHYRGRTIEVVYYCGRKLFEWSSEAKCCFATGVWKDDYPWDDNQIWKD